MKGKVFWYFKLFFDFFFFQNHWKESNHLYEDSFPIEYLTFDEDWSEILSLSQENTYFNVSNTFTYIENCENPPKKEEGKFRKSPNKLVFCLITDILHLSEVFE